MRWLAGMIMVLAAPVAAQEVDCAKAEAQLDLNLCAEQEWKEADVALNSAYKAARALMQQIDADLPEEERGAEAKLRDGQRAWVTFRDANCAAEGYLMHGGSAEPMVIFGCLTRLTQTRTNDLQLLVEGD